MKKNICKFVLLFLFMSVFFPLASKGQSEITPEEYQLILYKARVIDIKETREELSPNGQWIKTQIATIEILNQDKKGTYAEIRNTISGNPAYDIELKTGILISVHMEQWENGEVYFYVMGYDRTNYILQIIGIFLLCLLIIGGVKGAKAIVSLAVIILLIIYMLIPLLLKGYNPIILSIVTCTISTIVTLTIITGWNIKSISAIIGTVSGLFVGGILAYAYGVAAKLSGFSSAEAQMLLYIPQQIQLDYRGLLFSGILIGALGAAMDVSISISSALNELFEKDQNLSFKDIMKHGMNIGRDIMGTMANTLILAYTGGALSIILIFIAFNKSMYEIINLDSVATEIVRAVTGSVGLLFAIPFTALSFAILSKKIKVKEK